ncbi:MAG: hypothetical protein M3186_11015, partial [Actinomycetota bacterium]|nr:hypothetical protein [Actinomycetota bacterium]
VGTTVPGGRELECQNIANSCSGDAFRAGLPRWRPQLVTAADIVRPAWRLEITCDTGVMAADPQTHRSRSGHFLMAC